MPYISQERRSLLDSAIDALIAEIDDINHTDSQMIAGDLNYTITRILDGAYPVSKRYRHINEAIGVLECAKMELYRRVAAPYEDQKIFDEGDVYIFPGDEQDPTPEPAIDLAEQLARKVAVASGRRADY